MAEAKDQASDVGVLAETGAVSPATGAVHYAAFISYSHSDEETADWLHKRLESYRIPKGTVPGRTGQRIGKVFRDRAELASSHDLGGDIRRALDASDALILLCSPRAAKSPYVAEEIRRFKETGKGERIFAAIVDGEPHAAGKPGRSADDECFPRGLLYQVGPDGAFTDQPEPLEPIAADIRPGKDGRENASLKIIAGFLGVGLDDLVHREKRAENLRRLRANVIAGVMAVLALGAVVGGVIAWQLQGVAEARKVEAEKQKGEAEKQTAAALERLSNGIARESRAMFDSEAGDHARSLLMALYADPAASSSAIPAGLAPKDGYANARARLVAPFNHNRLDGELVGESGGAPGAYVTVMSAVAYSPDNRVVLTGTARGVVGVWDAATHRLLRTLPGYKQAIVSIDFTADGRLALITSYDGPPRIWDTASWQEVRRLNGTEASGKTTLSRDGLIVAGAVRVEGASRVRIWDFRTGEVLRTLSADIATNSGVALSPDRQTVAFRLREKGAQIWDVATGTLVREFKDTGDVSAIAFSSDGKLLATGDDGGNAQIWNASTGQSKLVMKGHTNTIESIAFSPDQRTVMTAGIDGLIRIWDVDGSSYDAERGKSLWTFGGREQQHVAVAALSPDGQHLASGYFEGVVRLWNLGPQEGLASMPVRADGYDYFREVTFSPDWSSMVLDSYQSPSSLWDPVTGKVLRALSGEKKVMETVAYSVDGHLLAGPSENGDVQIWDVATGKLLHVLSGHKGQVNAIAFSAGESLLATASEDATVKIWDIAAEKSLHTLTFGAEVDRVFAVAFSPDGKTLATGAFELDVRLWDVASGNLLRKLKGHESTILSVSFSRDGRFLLTGSGDTTARIWDVSTGVVARRLPGHGESLDAARFSPDGRYVITSASDGAKLWDASTGDALATIRSPVQHIGNGSVAFSPDQRKVVIGASHDEGVVTWTLPKIITDTAPDQLKAACAMLWHANAPLAFKRGDIATFGVLDGLAADPDHPEILASPCRSVLPAEAFDPATAKDGWVRVYDVQPGLGQMPAAPAPQP